LKLRVLEQCGRVPVSLEWSVPYGAALFHIGLHNISAAQGRQILAMLAEYTAAPHKGDLGQIFEMLAANGQTLIVFNHPGWDEAGIGGERHAALAASFLGTYRRWIHALELNGFRPWGENRQAIQMARAFEKPVISGGDRHGFEPNTLLDLTNAGTFSEYAEQVRNGDTHVLIRKQYREPLRLRTLQSLGEMLQNYPHPGRSWSRWTDRILYRCDDGEIRSVAEMFGARLPAHFELPAKAIGLLCHPNLRRTFRMLAPQGREFAR
jgi:hypothetical protein